MEDGGRTLSEYEDMGRHVVNFFMNAYKKEDIRCNNVIRISMLNNIPKVLGMEENDKLKEKVSKEEVKNLVSSMKSFKASGPDGFSPTFFQHFLEEIKNELIWATKDIIRIGKFLKRINKTFLVLVPKIQSPKTLSDLRLISLCNTIYKVFSKVLVNRIKPFLDKVIGSPQKGFVLGQIFLDTMISTHEIIHSMEKSKNMGMALKLDISKAYDRVNWTFLYEVLKQVGFKRDIVNLIKTMVETTQFEVLLNGTPWGNFEVGRVLRQGEPLSPYLFIMVVKVLGREVCRLVVLGDLKGIQPATTLMLEVIQQFVDNTFLFGESLI